MQVPLSQASGVRLGGWLLLPAFALTLLSSLARAEEGVAVPQTISLWNGQAPIGDGTNSDEEPQVTLYRAAPASGAAMVICPGGGYGGLVMGAEGTGIAQWLNKHGITGLVLKYRLPKGRPMVPLLDAQRALRLARSHSQDWGIDPQKIGIIGFSAGGHLASTAATHFDAGDAKATDLIEKLSCRPDFAILVYPVITMGDKGHAGSRKNLMGPMPAPETIDKFSNEKQVTAQTPPTFLAHAKNDTVVPPENSQMFVDALKANHVPARYLELAEGGHGLNGYKGPMWDAWQTQSLQWLAEQKFTPADNTSGAK